MQYLGDNQWIFLFLCTILDDAQPKYVTCPHRIKVVHMDLSCYSCPWLRKEYIGLSMKAEKNVYIIVEHSASQEIAYCSGAQLCNNNMFCPDNPSAIQGLVF